MNTEQTQAYHVVGSSCLLILRDHSGRSHRRLDGILGSGPKHVDVLPRHAKGSAEGFEPFATQGSPKRNRRLTLTGCAVLSLSLAAIAAVYALIRVNELIPRTFQTDAQSVCVATSWERMFHPSPFDDLCRQ